MSREAKINRWLHRFPLVLKMLMLTFIVAGIVWGGVDYFQTNRIKKLFMSQLTEDLSEEAENARLSFNYYIDSFRQTAKVFIKLKDFSDYVERQKWSAKDKIEVKYLRDLPPWLPGRLMLRPFAKPHFVFLLDRRGKVREVYQRHDKSPPPSLLEPSSILLAKTEGQSYMRTIDGEPYILNSETLSDPRGNRHAALLFASSIDEDLLNEGMRLRPNRLAALFTSGENPIVITSSDLKRIPAGISLQSIKEEYLVISKVFFDYGFSELEISPFFLISKKEVEGLVDAVVFGNRERHALSAIALVLTFSFIILRITSHIRGLTWRISDFSSRALGTSIPKLQKGDAFLILEERFQQLTDEVVQAQGIIKRQAEEKTHLIVNNAFDAIITMDADDLITTWNPRAMTIFGWTDKEAIGQKVSETIIPPQYREAHRQGLKHFLSTGKGTILNRQIEITALHRDGHEFPVELSVSPVLSGNNYIFIAIIRDITERKKTEERIQAALKEKEVLLREIHHRVKNNMQVISSLLRLQSEKLRDRREVEMLRDSQNRIKSMALIHEMLYQSMDLAHINFNDYIMDLTKGLYRAYGVDSSKIVLKIDAADILLGVDSAIPCGLIINELLSNSLKYAFPDGRKGKIDIALRKINEREIELIVGDNGTGLPADLDFRNTGSLGLKLVTMLAEDQLEGKIELDMTEGTKFRVRFKEIKKNGD